MTHEEMLEYAYRMGQDCALNGANTTNCNFRIFSKPEYTKAWERGNKKSLQPSERKGKR